MWERPFKRDGPDPRVRRTVARSERRLEPVVPPRLRLVPPAPARWTRGRPGLRSSVPGSSTPVGPTRVPPARHPLPGTPARVLVRSNAPTPPSNLASDRLLRPCFLPSRSVDTGCVRSDGRTGIGRRGGSPPAHTSPGPSSPSVARRRCPGRRVSLLPGLAPPRAPTVPLFVGFRTFNDESRKKGGGGRSAPPPQPPPHHPPLSSRRRPPPTFFLRLKIGRGRGRAGRTRPKPGSGPRHRGTLPFPVSSATAKTPCGLSGRRRRGGRSWPPGRRGRRPHLPPSVFPGPREPPTWSAMVSDGSRRADKRPDENPQFVPQVQGPTSGVGTWPTPRIEGD